MKSTLSNVLAVGTSVFFGVVLFSFAQAQGVTVTVVGNATSSVTPIIQNVIMQNGSGGTMNPGSNTASCVNFLNRYQKIGAYGEDVVKLQLFLNNVNGAKLNGKGYFGPVTQQEVRNFQYTYGIKPTGYQHVLTTKMINDIHCGRVAPKARKVYVSVPGTYRTSYVAPTPAASSGISMDTINKNSKNLVKEYQPPTTIKLTGSTSKPNINATKTSFWENLERDWNKIKENYKAYLLVFALVVALFWFLRKAATE